MPGKYLKRLTIMKLSAAWSTVYNLNVSILGTLVGTSNPCTRADITVTRPKSPISFHRCCNLSLNETPSRTQTHLLFCHSPKEKEDQYEVS